MRCDDHVQESGSRRLAVLCVRDAWVNTSLTLIASCDIAQMTDPWALPEAMKVGCVLLLVLLVLLRLLAARMTAWTLVSVA